jgi:lambda family phage portal protein
MAVNTRALGERIDRLVELVSPAWAAARSENRVRSIRASILARHYDAAAISRRTKDWRASNASGSAVIGSDLDILRNRAREMARNNEWMAKGLAVIEDDVVGTGFTTTFEHKDQGVAKAAGEAWASWADTTQVDPEGLLDFWGLLAQAVRGMAEGGDMLVRRRWRRPEDGLTVPLQLQLLEGEHLDSLRDVVQSDGSRIVQGVEHDLLGRRVAYWLLRDHPGDYQVTLRESSRVPATEVLHLFRVERKGAVRGIPWGAPCLWRLRALKSYEDAKLEHQRMSNMVVHVITVPEGVKEFAQLDEEGDIDLPVDTIGPGTTQYLRPGEVFTQTTPPPPGDDHGDYMRVGLLAVSAALGVPYEALTGDLRNTTFSSGRMGWLQWQRRIEAYRWRLIVPRICDPAARWFLEALALKDARFLDCRPKWDPPHREMIDPSAEVAAFEKSVRAGFRSRNEIVRSLGGNPDQVLAEAIADRKAQQAGDVGFTTDPKNDVGQQDPTQGPGRKPGEAANTGG